MLLLSKERRLDSAFRGKLIEAVKTTAAFYGERPGNPFESKKNNVVFAVDVIEGLTSLTRGDLQGIRPLAVKMGGFPSQLDKLEQFIKVLKQNKDAINFKSVESIARSNEKALTKELLPLPAEEQDQIAELIA